MLHHEKINNNKNTISKIILYTVYMLYVVALDRTLRLVCRSIKHMAIHIFYNSREITHASSYVCGKQVDFLGERWLYTEKQVIVVNVHVRVILSF